MSLWKKLGFDELWETCKEIVKDVQEFDRKIDEKTEKWRVERKPSSSKGIPSDLGYGEFYLISGLDDRKND